MDFGLMRPERCAGAEDHGNAVAGILPTHWGRANSLEHYRQAGCHIRAHEHPTRFSDRPLVPTQAPSNITRRLRTCVSLG